MPIDPIVMQAFYQVARKSVHPPARQYAQAAVDGSVEAAAIQQGETLEKALRFQANYVLANLGRDRGEEFQRIREILRNFVKASQRSGNPVGLPGFPTGGYGPRKTLVARWESRGKKHWVELYIDSVGAVGETGNYTYRSSNGGGNLGRTAFHTAMEYAKRQADLLGVQMARVFPQPGQRPPWRDNPTPFSPEDNAQALAAEFSRVLARWLTPAQLKEAVLLNRSEKHPGVCHSHDHCDANMAMEEAFTNVVGRPPFSSSEDDEDPALRRQYEEDTDLWNAAWDMAKRAEFRPLSVGRDRSRNPGGAEAWDRLKRMGRAAAIHYLKGDE